MKLMLFKWLLLSVATLAGGAVSAQMIKAPTNTKPVDPPKKKPAAKPVVKFKDEDDDAKADSVASSSKKVDNTFAYLILKANRGAAVNVTINDNESGKIRAGMSKKIPLNNSDGMRISLNDGMGNLYDTTFVVDDKDAGHTIVVAFPEVDYAAIRAEEARLKKEADDRIRLQKEEEARKIKEAEEEAIRVQKAAEEALRQQRITALTETETSLKELIRQSISDKTNLQQLIDKIRKGEIGVTPEVTKAHDNFVSDKTLLNDNLKTYTDSALVYNMKERRETFMKETKADQDKILKDEFYSFIPAVIAGKQPMSANVQIAFKASRSSDIPFFIAKDSLDEPVIAGKRPLMYALEVKSDSSIFRYLFQNGVSANNFGSRFPENKEIYATPLAYASINGNADVIRLFADHEAVFFPTSMSKLDKKKQVKFLLTKFGSNADVMAVLKEKKYDMDDGTAAILSAIASIDSSMVQVEGGQFTMGCTNELAADCAGDEKPAIQVTVDGFHISKYEITQKIWAAIMDDENPSFFKDCPSCPVEMVSWKAVSEFIQRLNKLSGKNYRLPTEAEWEFAARGGKSENKDFIYAGGKDINDVAWYKDNSNKPSPVGTKTPNALGLYDMSGSVSEWCSDFYAADYFTRSTLVNPKGPEVSSQKVTRGGSFMQSSWSSRLSNREGHEETFNNNNTGFRLAMTVQK